MEPTNIQQSSRVSPKDFFLNLGAIVSLYVLVGGFLTFVFSVINQIFPDTLSGYGYYSEGLSAGIKTGLSIIIVAFPVLMYLSHAIFKELLTHPEKREYALRRWLAYFTLFVTGLAIAIDVIVLLNYLLDGEITIRFILKVVSVLVTAGLIFWYYVSYLKGSFYEKPKNRTIFVWVVTGIIVASIIGGFSVIGSPVTQRQLRADERRVNDLNTIQWEIINYYQQSGRLPSSLGELNDPIRGYEVAKDPITQAPYEYAVTAGTSSASQFELCATFALPSRQRGSAARDSSVVFNGADTWVHEAGRTCFTRTVDPERYPISKPRTSVINN